MEILSRILDSFSLFHGKKRLFSFSAKLCWLLSVRQLIRKDFMERKKGCQYIYDRKMPVEKEDCVRRSLLSSPMLLNSTMLPSTLSTEKKDSPRSRKVSCFTSNKE